MKQLKFFAQLCAVVLFLSSCNNAGDKKTADTTADTTTTKKDTVATPPPAPVPAAPMLSMTATFKVANYAKWKKGYDMHDSARLANGLHNYVIARGTEDSNKVLVAVRMDDVNKAKAFAADKDLKTRMAKSGVIGVPAFDFIETVMRDTTDIQKTVRLMIKSTVKDWDIWKKGFDKHIQVRKDSGLVDRLVGHTIGDPTHITLVFAVGDMAKAKAFLASKDLKDRMAESGVVGKPNMFFYKVVEKY